MSSVSAETQFSIYSIDFDSIEEHFDIKGKRGTSDYMKGVLNALINSIISIINEKMYSQIYRVKYKEFCGVVFKTVHEPAWKTVAEQIMNCNEIEGINAAQGFLTNTNVSYVLFHSVGSSLYACTGGFGSNYISKFTVKNYGLSLLPKLIDRNNPIVKNVIQNNLIGNQSSTNKVNRKTTTLSLEQNMGSVFRQLIIEPDRSIVESLGVVFSADEPTSKKVSLINKDSLIVRRSMSLDELSKLLGRLSTLEKKKDAFALNYLVLARKKGIKNADLFEQMVSDFAKGDNSRFVLVGDEYERYYANASRYILKDSIGQTLIDQITPIELQDVLSVVKAKGRELSRTSITAMLKHWQLSTEDNAGAVVLFPISIFDALQGFVEYGENHAPCYLFNGSWFVFDSKYEDLLSQQFEELYDQNKIVADGIIHKWKLSHESVSEDQYNDWLSKKANVQVTHKVLAESVEIADAVFYDDGTVYLMHNKDKFSGIGARDLTNQILSSSESLSIHRFSLDATSFFEDYYTRVVEKANKEHRQVTIGEKEFVDLFMNTKNTICYIAGYLHGVNKHSKSTYAKYLSIEIKQRLKEKGYDYILMGLTES